jgi:hypothetical protein
MGGQSPLLGIIGMSEHDATFRMHHHVDKQITVTGVGTWSLSYYPSYLLWQAAWHCHDGCRGWLVLWKFPFVPFLFWLWLH